jgi:hypothetical protein
MMPSWGVFKSRLKMTDLGTSQQESNQGKRDETQGAIFLSRLPELEELPEEGCTFPTANHGGRTLTNPIRII